MRSVNKVMIIGNVCRKPEIRTTASGQKIVTFCIATNRDWVSNTGEKKSLAEYHNIAAWGRLAELCMQYLSKGKLVYVEGYLKTRSWETENGTRAYRTEIIAQDMIKLNKRSEDDLDDNSDDHHMEDTSDALHDMDDDFFADSPSDEV